MHYSSNSSLAFAAAVLALLLSTVSAFAPTTTTTTTTRRQTASHSPLNKKNTQLEAHRQGVSTSSTESSRRNFISTVGSSIAAAASVVLMTPARPASAAAASTKDALVADLNESYAKLSTVPDLLQQSEWDKVRTILKSPPLNQLWNLGDSKNTLVQLAKETGDMELLEAKDELSISLQMTDQYTYDNVFVYFQPGNGKVKVKEPVEMAEKAMSQLKEVLDFVGKE
eukprot:CAMPEP_0181038910 /NCGR_PEP_ID=MMETSP1070-20121207/10181_1 /TAXON_ID=265543 /ORGANISM="Minutocellus polymorphus, Strain NH13" /LENGTH=225 /DNA_ID=CAMNT_0023116713 /DNA_START=61 /DNA_END=738 /DNA_ORIENTATION=-